MKKKQKTTVNLENIEQNNISQTTAEKPNNKIEDSFLKKNSIALLSLFVAICSFIFTMYQGYKTRENYMLMTQPKLQINLHTKETDMNLSYYNGGVGPAIIDDIILNCGNGKTYSSKVDNLNFWSNVFTDYNINDTLQLNFTDHIFTASGTFIPIKENLNFLNIKNTKKLDNNNIEKLTKIFDNTTLKISYHSIYGTQYIDSIKFAGIDLMDIRDN